MDERRLGLHAEVEQHLSITAKGTNLPVKETSTDAGGEKITTTISKWGEAVVVHAPAASTTIAAATVTG